MLKTNILLLIILISLPNCTSTKEKLNTLPFKHEKFIDLEGISTDSSLKFFPPELIIDTSFAKMDLFSLKLNSYMLFKMKEPVLHDHFLKREIYRLTALRAFNVPLLIRIEKFRDSVTLIIKKLNRGIMFPFIIYGEVDSLAYTEPHVNEYDSTQNESYALNDKDRESFSDFKKRNDSIAKIQNNVNYFLVLDLHKTLSISVWDSLQNQIDSTYFWRTKPDVALNYVQGDGSKWIFEGHNKFGYQIKIIPSPHFKNYEYENEFDQDNSYARLFYHIIKLAKLTDEKLY
jgi:hypothetical protein